MSSSTLTLAQYVRRRNGVPLGATGSLRGMLQRSLGASSFAGFWHYWNPIWGYYLARLVYRPVRRYFPASLATVVTFSVSGALHDLAIFIAGGSYSLLFTSWFTLMSLWLLISQSLRLDYGHLSWPLRALSNLLPVTLCLMLVKVSPLAAYLTVG